MRTEVFSCQHACGNNISIVLLSDRFAFVSLYTSGAILMEVDRGGGEGGDNVYFITPYCGIN